MSPKPWKLLLGSPEFCTGGVLIILGLAAWAAGIHALLASVLAPFGIGLILSEAAALTVRTARERVKVRAKVRSRRDE